MKEAVTFNFDTPFASLVCSLLSFVLSLCSFSLSLRFLPYSSLLLCHGWSFDRPWKEGVREEVVWARDEFIYLIHQPTDHKR